MRLAARRQAGLHLLGRVAGAERQRSPGQSAQGRGGLLIVALIDDDHFHPRRIIREDAAECPGKAGTPIAGRHNHADQGRVRAGRRVLYARTATPVWTGLRRMMEDLPMDVDLSSAVLDWPVTS